MDKSYYMDVLPWRDTYWNMFNVYEITFSYMGDDEHDLDPDRPVY